MTVSTAINLTIMRRIFAPRFKLPVHVVELIISLVVLILGLVRLALRNRNAPRTRSGSMALGMAAKSIVIILYQVLSQHTKYFRKWMSFKANLILNCLEIVFWAAVAFMTLQANTASCTGVTCALGWVILVLGIIMCKLSFFEAGVSWFEFKDYKTAMANARDDRTASSSTTIQINEESRAKRAEDSA
ncbi:cytochrome P450 [Fusarium albosuccineum]|uniref:Cytochrome P450 n=1 Tax=Fusarium albosuccineum TaxID=1237068 RepID=A0A8H4LR84_9HYPO|nr:cytochrome P450 [Fusarium albosuccineum]